MILYSCRCHQSHRIENPMAFTRENCRYTTTHFQFSSERCSSFTGRCMRKLVNYVRCIFNMSDCWRIPFDDSISPIHLLSIISCDKFLFSTLHVSGNKWPYIRVLCMCMDCFWSISPFYSSTFRAKIDFPSAFLARVKDELRFLNKNKLN